VSGSNCSSSWRRGRSAIFDVVLDGVAAGEDPAAKRQCQQEGGDAEGDDDGGEYEGLGERVGDVGGVDPGSRTGGAPRVSPDNRMSMLTPCEIRARPMITRVRRRWSMR
jgi:hypothetical protein